MPEHPLLLSVQNLGRQVRQRWLWRGISFDLRPGETLGVVGPSGIGKSLLMRSLTGLDNFDEGQVIFQGRSLAQWDKPLLRSRLLYLAQSPGWIEGTVEDNLQAVFRLWGHRDRRYSRDQALELLRQMGRGDAFLSQPSERLSGGERQLMGLARGLQLRPQVLLLDEPTAALDVETTARVEQLLQTWVKDGNDRSLLWISHSPDQIQRMTRSQLDLSGFAP